MARLSSVGKVMAKYASEDDEPQLTVGNTPDILNNVAPESSAMEPGSVSSASASSNLRRTPVRMSTDSYMRLLASKKRVGLQRQSSTPTGSRKLEEEPQLAPTNEEEPREKQSEPTKSQYSSMRASKTTSNFTPSNSITVTADVEPNIWSALPPIKTPRYDLKEESRRTLPRVNSDTKPSSPIIQIPPSGTRPSPSPPPQIDQARLDATKEEVRKILYGPKQSNNASSSSGSAQLQTPPVDKRPPFVVNGVRQPDTRASPTADDQPKIKAGLPRNKSASGLPRVTSGKGDLRPSKTSSILNTLSTVESSTLAKPEVRLKPKASELSLEELLKVPSFHTPEVEEELRQMAAAKEPSPTSRPSFAERLSDLNKGSLAYELQLLGEDGSDEDLSDKSLPPPLPMISGNYRPAFGWSEEGRQSYSFLDTGKINSVSMAAISEEPVVQLLPPGEVEVPEYAKKLKMVDIREQLEDIQITLKSLDQNLAGMGKKNRQGPRNAPDAPTTSIVKQVEEHSKKKSSSKKTGSKETKEESAAKKTTKETVSKDPSGDPKKPKSKTKKIPGIVRPDDRSYNHIFDELEVYFTELAEQNKKSSDGGSQTSDRMKSLEKRLLRQSEDFIRYHEQQSVLVNQLAKQHEKLSQHLLGDYANVGADNIFSEVGLPLEAGTSASTTRKSMSKLKTASTEVSTTGQNEPSVKSTQKRSSKVVQPPATMPPRRRILSIADRATVTLTSKGAGKDSGKLAPRSSDNQSAGEPLEKTLEKWITNLWNSS